MTSVFDVLHALFITLLTSGYFYSRASFFSCAHQTFHPRKVKTNSSCMDSPALFDKIHFESQYESREGFRRLLSAFRVKIIDWPRWKTDLYLNCQNIAISSWLEWREYEQLIAGETLWNIHANVKDITIDRIVIMGMRNTTGMFRKRYNDMNNRLCSSGFFSWYWQMKWNISEIQRNNFSRTWLSFYTSRDFKTMSLDNQTIKYEWSLSLKHIMTMYDAVYGNLSRNHAEYSLTDKGIESSLPPLEFEDSILLIMEDDAIFVPFFKQKLMQILATLSHIEPWIVWIGGCCNLNNDVTVNHTLSIRAKFNFKMPGIHFTPFLELKPTWNSRCMTAYAMNKMGARVILNGLSERAKTSHYSPIDVEMRHILGHSKNKILSYWSEPILSYQSNKAVINMGGDDTSRSYT